MITLLEHARTIRKTSRNGKVSSISYWKGRCGLCGSVKEYSKSNIIGKRQKSCGCWRRSGKLRHGTSAIQLQFYNSLICNSAKRGHTVELTFEEAVSLAEKNCVYCGSGPATISNNKGSRSGLYPPWRRNGIDRVDSSIGYTRGNSVSCCSTCNMMKGSLSQKEFFNQIKKIHSLLGGKV